MSCTTNMEIIQKMARALLVGFQLDHERYEEVGPHCLIFKRGAGEKEACICLSEKTYLQNEAGSTELFDHNELGRKNRTFLDQVKRLYGRKVIDVILEADDLIVIFDCGTRLLVSGNVKDPDGGGWNLHGHRLVSIGQDLFEGYPVGRIPNWLGTLFPSSDEWGDDRSN